MLRRCAAVISSIEERLDAPTAKGLAQAVSRAIRDAALAAGRPAAPDPPGGRGADDVADDRERGLAAARPVGHHPVRRPPGHDRRADRARRRALHPGAAARVTRQPRPVDRHPRQQPCCPPLVPVLSALTDPTTPSSYLDDPVLDELRARAGAGLAVCRRRPPRRRRRHGRPRPRDAGAAAPGRPRARREPGVPAPARPARGPRGRRSSACRSTRRASTSTASRRCSPRRPAAVVIQPRGQNPTGVSMSPTRARRLAALLRGRDCIVIEDDSSGPISTVGADQPRRVDPRPGAAHPQLQQVARPGPAARRRERPGRRCSPRCGTRERSARGGRAACSSACSPACCATRTCVSGHRLGPGGVCPSPRSRRDPPRDARHRRAGHRRPQHLGPGAGRGRRRPPAGQPGHRGDPGLTVLGRTRRRARGSRPRHDRAGPREPRRGRRSHRRGRDAWAPGPPSTAERARHRA